MENKFVTEEYVIRGGDKEIYGKLYRPIGEGMYPAVIISHGYNGSHANWEMECELFASKGYEVYAYDFCGGAVKSKSSGKTKEMTIFSEKEDLLTVFETVSGRKEVDAEKIFLFGESQGGFVTTLAAEELADRVKGVILYYPALNIPDDWRNKYATVEEIPEITELWGMELGREFFLSIRDFYTFEHIGSYENKVLIVQGDQDVVVSMENAKRAVNLYPDARLIVMEGEGHGYRPEAAARAGEAVLRFMEEAGNR